MPRSWIHQLAVAGVLYGFWVVLSGRLEPKYLVFGAVCVLGVTLISARLLYSEEGPKDARGQRWLTMMPWHRVVVYTPWLAWEIAKANLLLIPMILGPRSRLRPRMFAFRTRLDREVARTTLGNSITMTPGTLTVDVSDDGEFLIHAVDAASQEGVVSRRMERMIGWAFDDQGRPDENDEPSVTTEETK